MYGFYDLLEMQWRLLRAESCLRETVVFVPSGDGSPLAFARPFLERLVQEGFTLHESASKGIERRFVSESFSRRAEQDEPTARDDDSSWVPGGSPAESRSRPGFPTFVEVLSAPGESRQAAEVARQVISWAGEGIRFGDMAVLARLAEPTLTEVSRALDRARVPHVLSAGRPFTASRAARTALHLLSISSSDWGREEVISFLSVADLRQRAWPAERQSVALDAKDHLEGTRQGSLRVQAETASVEDLRIGPAEDSVSMCRARTPSADTAPSEDAAPSADGTSSADAMTSGDEERAASSREIQAALLNDPEIAPAEWDLVSAEAGIVKGKDSWNRELRRESARAHAALRGLEADGASGSGADRQDDDAVSGSAIDEARRRSPARGASKDSSPGWAELSTSGRGAAPGMNALKASAAPSSR